MRIYILKFSYDEKWRVSVCAMLRLTEKNESKSWQYIVYIYIYMWTYIHYIACHWPQRHNNCSLVQTKITATSQLEFQINFYFILHTLYRLCYRQISYVVYCKQILTVISASLLADSLPGLHLKVLSYNTHVSLWRIGVCVWTKCIITVNYYEVEGLK